MATIYDLKRRAKELAAVTETNAVDPAKVGNLIDDTLELIDEYDKNVVSLGIRKTYATLAAMEADKVAPSGDDGKKLRFGQLVSVYDVGDIYAFRNPGWKLVSNTKFLITQELGESQTKVMSQSAVSKATGVILTTFHPLSKNYSIWKQRILGAYFTVPQMDNIYYSPAVVSKNSNSISIKLYYSTSITGNSYTFVGNFFWNGNTSIDQIVQITTDLGVIYINPSKFDNGSFNGISYDLAGFDESTINNKNKQYLLLESWYLTNIVYPVGLFSKKWIGGVYINKEGIAVNHASFIASDFLNIGGVKSLVFTGNIYSAAAVNNISFYDRFKNYLYGWFPSGITQTAETFEIPMDVEYVRLSNIKQYDNLDININNNKAVSLLLENVANNIENKYINYSFELSTGFIDFLGKLHSPNESLSTFKCTYGFYPVKPNSIYYFSGKINPKETGLNFISFYSDKDEGTFIGGIKAPISGADIDYLEYPIIIPKSANYIRISGGVVFSPLFKFTTTIGDLCFLLQRENERNKYEDIFALPSYLDCVIGRNNDIFLDSVSCEPDNSKDTVLLFGGKGAVSIQRRENTLRWNPTDTSTPITVGFSKVNNGLRVAMNNNLIFRPVLKDNGDRVSEKSICISGDSLVNAGYPTAELYRLLSEDGDFIINQIGTRYNSGSKHEGRGSWSWSEYVNPKYEKTDYAGAKNQFMINGQLNFKLYMQNNFPDLQKKEIDYFIMSLGTNDVSQGYTVPSKDQYDRIIANARIFIDAFFSDETGFPNAKFAVGLPGCGASYFPGADSRMETFKKAIQLLNQKYIEEFDNGRYHPNLTCVMHGAYIDRFNTYPYIDEPINDLTPLVTVRRFTNSVHPTEAGYRLWGRGYYGKIRAFLNGYL